MGWLALLVTLAVGRKAEVIYAFAGSRRPMMVLGQGWQMRVVEESVVDDTEGDLEREARPGRLRTRGLVAQRWGREIESLVWESAAR